MSYNAEFRQLLADMGLDSTKRLPDAGTEPVVVWWRGYKVVAWVTPKLASMSMRVHVHCPVCGREIAAARLTHHVRTAACHARVPVTTEGE